MTVAHLQRWTCDLGGCGASVVVAVDVIVSDPRPPSGWGRHVLRWEGDERTLHFCPRCEEQSRGWGREPERGEYLALSHSLSKAVVASAALGLVLTLAAGPIAACPDLEAVLAERFDDQPPVSYRALADAERLRDEARRLEIRGRHVEAARRYVAALRRLEPVE